MGMVALDATQERPGHGEVAATMLTDLLFEEARHLATNGRVGRLSAVIREHHRLGLHGVHYSRFGVLLEPALLEVLGPGLRPNTASAWVCAYWFIIRQLGVQGAASFRLAPRNDEQRPAVTRVGR